MFVYGLFVFYFYIYTVYTYICVCVYICTHHMIEYIHILYIQKNYAVNISGETVHDQNQISWSFQWNTSTILWTSNLGFFFPVKQKNKSETHTHTHTTIPHIYSCSHFDTHAYQVPHLNRCSGAILSSTPLSCHPSPASNPSLRRLPSVDQRCKTIPPAPELFLQPFIPASLLSNWKHVGQRERETLWGERAC